VPNPSDASALGTTAPGASGRLRVALYGHGHMGRHHARHLAANPRVDLVVIDPALAMTGDDHDIDAAVIATPTTTHRAVSEPLLERGIPCLVEKPLAGGREDAAALATYPHVMVGHIERYNPAFAPVRTLDARFVQAERLAAWSVGAGRSGDVDVIADLMIHDLDLFLSLAPGDEVVDVRANGIAVTTGRIDIAQARVELASGRVGTFTASRVSRAGARRFRVFAPGEYWSLDLGGKQAARATYGEAGLVEAVVPVDPADALADQLRAFLAFAAGEAPNPIPGTDGLRAVDLALRIREAIPG